MKSASIVLAAAYRGGERFHCSPKQLIGAKHSFVLAEHTSHRFHDKQTSAEVASRERNWNTFADRTLATVDSCFVLYLTSLQSIHPSIVIILYFLFFRQFLPSAIFFLLCCLFTHSPLRVDEAKWLRKSCEQKKAQSGWRNFSSALHRHAVCLL